MVDANNNQVSIDIDATKARRELGRASQDMGRFDRVIKGAGQSSEFLSRRLVKLNDSLRGMGAAARLDNFLTGGRRTGGQNQGIAGISPSAVTNADKLNDRVNKLNRSSLRLVETFGKVNQSLGFGFVRGRGQRANDLIFPSQERADRALNNLRSYRNLMREIRGGSTAISVAPSGQSNISGVGGVPISGTFASRAEAQRFHDRWLRRQENIRFASRSNLEVRERIDPITSSGGFQAVYGKKNVPIGGVFGSSAEVEEFLRSERAMSDMYRDVQTRKARVARQGNVWGIRGDEGFHRMFPGDFSKARATEALRSMRSEIKDYNRIRGIHPDERTLSESRLAERIRGFSPFRRGAKISIQELAGETMMQPSGQYGVFDPKSRGWMGNKFFGDREFARAYLSSTRQMGDIIGATGKGVSVGEVFDGQRSRMGFSAVDPKGNVLYTGKTEQAVNKWIDAQEKQTKAMKRNTDSQRRQGVSFLELTSLMIKFGIAMELISLPFRIAGLVGGVISGGADREQQLAHIRALTNITKPGITHMGLEAYRVMQQFPVEGEYFTAGEEIASSLATLAPSTPGMGMDAEAKTVYDFLRLSAQYAQAVNVNIETAVKAMTSLGSATKQNVQFLEGYGDIMATTIDVGRLSANTVSNIAGEQIGYITSIWGNQPERQREEFQSVMELTAAASQTLPEGFLRASLTNWIKAIRSPDTGAKEYLGLLRKNRDVDLTFSELQKIGFRRWIQKYSAAIGPYGSLVSDWIQTPSGQEAIQTEGTEDIARQVAANQIFSILFPNIRGERFQIATLADLGRVLQDVVVGFENTSGAMNRQAAIRGDTFRTQTLRAGFTWNMIQDSLFQSSGGGGLRQLIENFNTDFNQLMNTELYRESPIEDKLTMLFDKGFDLLDRYMQTDGYTKIMNILSKIISAMVELLTKIVLSPEVQKALFDLGWAIGAGLASGISRGMVDNTPEFFKWLIPGGLDDPIINHMVENNPMNDLQEKYRIMQSPGYQRLKTSLEQEQVRQEMLILNNPNLAPHESLDQLMMLRDRMAQERYTALEQYIENQLNPTAELETSIGRISGYPEEQIMQGMQQSPSATVSQTFHFYGDVSDDGATKIAAALTELFSDEETDASSMSTAHFDVRVETEVT